MARKILMLGVLAVFCLQAAELEGVEKDDSEQVDSLESKIESIVNKAGIHFNGKAQAEYLLSRLDKDEEKTRVVPDNKIDEAIAYASVDFDIHARPNAALTARVIFRMHQDFRNFFSDLKNPVTARWLSIDGLVNDIYGYNVGYFKEGYSPLTLYGNEVNPPFEPDIFKGKREEAMDEAFLGNNERVLQGVNFNFDAQIQPLFREAHLNLLGARLRLNETSIQNGSMVASSIETAPYDKYVIGSNLDLELEALPQLGIGATYMRNFESQYTGNEGEVHENDIERDVTTNAAGRFTFGTEPFIDPETFNVMLSFEGALSLDKDSSWLADSAADTADWEADWENDKGSAIDAGLEISSGLGGFGNVCLNVSYINNSSNYKNELAQSPSFYAQRIMNIDNDGGNGDLYTPFDAMYRHVFKFVPEESTNDYLKAPMEKIAYTNASFTLEELEGLRKSGLLDPYVNSMSMPFGPATPNRSGIKIKLDGDILNEGIGFGIGLKSLKQTKQDTMVTEDDAEVGLAEASFFSFSGGGYVEFADLIQGFIFPSLKLNAKVGTEKTASDGAEGAAKAVSEYENSLMDYSLGFKWTPVNRMSLLVGLQSVEENFAANYAQNVALSSMADAPVWAGMINGKVTHMQWAVGLQYRVSDGGVVTGSFGKLHSEWDYNDDTETDVHSRWQTDLDLTIEF